MISREAKVVWTWVKKVVRHQVELVGWTDKIEMEILFEDLSALSIKGH